MSMPTISASGNLSAREKHSSPVEQPKDRIRLASGFNFLALSNIRGKRFGQVILESCNCLSQVIITPMFCENDRLLCNSPCMHPNFHHNQPTIHLAYSLATYPLLSNNY